MSLLGFATVLISVKIWGIHDLSKHFTSSSLLFGNFMYCKLCFYFSLFQPLNFAVITFNSWLIIYMLMQVDIWLLRRDGRRKRVLNVSSIFVIWVLGYFPSFLLNTLLLISRDRSKNFLSILLHKEKFILLWVDIFDLNLLPFELPLHLLIFFIPPDQLFDFTLDIRIVLLAYMIVLIIYWFRTGHSVRNMICKFSFWWTYCTYGLIGIDGLVVLVVLFR